MVSKFSLGVSFEIKFQQCVHEYWLFRVIVCLWNRKVGEQGFQGIQAVTQWDVSPFRQHQGTW